MSTQALVEGFRGSSQDPGVTVHFDQVWFDQLSLEALLVDGNIVRYRARSHDGVQSWLVRTRDQVTFTVLGCDETSFPSDAVVADLLDRELTA